MFLHYCQLVAAIAALLVQFVVICLIWPMRRMIPRRLWWPLVWLNAFVVLRRVLNVFQDIYRWHGDGYTTITSCIGLGFSIAMLMMIVRLRFQFYHLLRKLTNAEDVAAKEFKRTQQWAAATIELANSTATPVKDSIAYQLAVKFAQDKSAPPKHKK